MNIYEKEKISKTKVMNTSPNIPVKANKENPIKFLIERIKLALTLFVSWFFLVDYI